MVFFTDFPNGPRRFPLKTVEMMRLLEHKGYLMGKVPSGLCKHAHILSIEGGDMSRSLKCVKYLERGEINFAIQRAGRWFLQQNR